MEFKCSKKASLCEFLMIVKVSSTNLFHSVGGHGDVARALISRSSLNKFATMGLIGDPMAAPSFCSYNLPWNEKYVFLRQKSSRQEMCFTVMVVLRCKLLSSSKSIFIYDHVVLPFTTYIMAITSATLLTLQITFTSGNNIYQTDMAITSAISLGNKIYHSKPWQ